MILAAGRGLRMRPLTDTLPKPLLSVAGKSLLVRHILQLRSAGYVELVINHAWLGSRIVEALGDGSQYGVHIDYSAESSALETAGGIARALPFLGKDAFLVVNGDVYCEYDFTRVPALVSELQSTQSLAYLVLVPNPPHHLEGDFILQHGWAQDPHQNTGGKALSVVPPPCYTFSGIGVYDPQLFAHLDPNTPAKLAPLLRSAMRERLVAAQLYTGSWDDVGTVDRLEALNARLCVLR